MKCEHIVAITLSSYFGLSKTGCSLFCECGLYADVYSVFYNDIVDVLIRIEVNDWISEVGMNWENEGLILGMNLWACSSRKFGNFGLCK